MSVKFNQIKVYQHVWINQHFRLNFRSYAKRYKAKEKVCLLQDDDSFPLRCYFYIYIKKLAV